MFLSTILLALIVGALAGGGFPRLSELKLRWTWLLILAIALRVVASLSREIGIDADIPVGFAYIGAYLLIFVWLAGNWRVPGLQIAAVGIGANMLALLLNAGQMPIWSAAFFAAGFTQADIVNDVFHFLLETDTVAGFIARGGIFGDVIPLPIPVIRDVISIGDVLLAMGIFWAIVYSMTRAEAPLAVGHRPGHDPDGAARRGRRRDDRPLVRRCGGDPGRDDGRAGRGGRRAAPVALPAPRPQPQLQPAVDRPAGLAARRSHPHHRARRTGGDARHRPGGGADLRGDRGARA